MHKVDYIHAGAIIYPFERIVEGTGLKIVPVPIESRALDTLPIRVPPTIRSTRAKLAYRLQKKVSF